LTLKIALERGSCVYPTRNFATLGNSVTPVSNETVARSFLSGSACRHAVRTISSLSEITVPRVWSLRGQSHCATTSLLIVRTRRIVTSIAHWYRGILGVSSKQRGFITASKVLTVIVTAAVYRRLGSELRRTEVRLTPPLNVPAPGRRQWVYSALRLRTHLCF
jgi:hypothetical protein